MLYEALQSPFQSDNSYIRSSIAVDTTNNFLNETGGNLKLEDGGELLLE